MYEIIDYRNGYHVNGAIHLLRKSLDCDQIGLTVAKCGPCWTRMCAWSRTRPSDPPDDAADQKVTLSTRLFWRPLPEGAETVLNLLERPLGSL